MFEYNVKIKKVSGRLNESVLPKKNLVVKSKSKLAKRNVLKEAAKYLLENYGLELGDAEVSSKPKRKAPLQKERFTTEELLGMCERTNNGEYRYSEIRTTPDGRDYVLQISSAATGGRKVWVWSFRRTANPLNTKSCALYDIPSKTWMVKKRNNYIDIVD
jgi:hypothetical protein